MVAIAESFALYFAVRRGLSPSQVAIVTTVPLFFGALVNWIFPMLIRTSWLKRAILLCFLVQIAGLGCLVKAAISEDHFFWTFVGLCFYWTGGMGASPLWIDWISGWLPQERFGRFYSRRSGTLSFITFLTFFAASAIVQKLEMPFSFVIIFSMAFLARSISFFLIVLQTTPHRRQNEESIQQREPVRWSWKTLSIVIGSAALFKLVANFGSPFFLPFMVNELQFDPFEIAIVNGMSFLGLAIFMASFGEALRSFQPITGLQLAMLMASLNCLLWTWVRTSLPASFLQMFSGLNWALFDLSLILIIQSNFPGAARRLIGIQMALVNLAVIAGSLCGSYLLENGISSLNLFRISSAARFGVAFLFMGIVLFSKEMRVPLKNYGSFLKTAFVVRQKN